MRYYYKVFIFVFIFKIIIFNQAFNAVDVILSPTTPDIAFEIGSKSKDPIEMYKQDIYTIPANLAGLPGISIPCGLHKGLPMGLQLISNKLEESTILRAAHNFQQSTDWHLNKPGLN